MSRDKKTKGDDIAKLRKILDNPSDTTIKKILTEDEKALRSIQGRLTDTSPQKKHTPSEHFIRKYDTLEPRISIHPKTPTPQQSITAQGKKEQTTHFPEFTPVFTPPAPQPALSQEPVFTSEELYEVEKVSDITPEFVEVTPADVPKKKPSLTMITKKQILPESHQNIPEWKPVETETIPQKKQTESKRTSEESSTNTSTISLDEKHLSDSLIPEFERVEIPILPKKRRSLARRESSIKQEETPEPTVEFHIVEQHEPSIQEHTRKQDRLAKKAEKQKQKEEKRQKKLELKKLKKETREKEKEAQRLQKEQQKTKPAPQEKPIQNQSIPEIQPVKTAIDISAFEGVKSIDEKTATLLYTHGYFSVENLRNASINDLVQIRGIKRKHAKQIKKEIEEKTVKPKDTEFIPKKQKLKKKQPKEEQLEDISEWESYHADEMPESSSLIAPCYYRGFTLYKKEMAKRGGKKTTVHFFSKDTPASGEPTQVPEGYQIAMNKKTDIPYLKKKK